MIYRIVIQPEAHRDIDDAFAYIYRRSPMNAERWFSGLWDAIMSLRRFPRRCGPARESGRFKEELRQLVFKSYRIIFTIDKSTVRVVHIRHAARRAIGEPENDDDE